MRSLSVARLFSHKLHCVHSGGKCARCSLAAFVIEPNKIRLLSVRSVIKSCKLIHFTQFGFEIEFRIRGKIFSECFRFLRRKTQAMSASFFGTKYWRLVPDYT